MTNTATLSLALTLALTTPALAGPDPESLADGLQTDEWQAVLEAAEGQTVYWNAWGGSTTTNAFIDWVASRVKEDYGVTLEHVKLSDTADAVSRVLSEQQAGQNEGGAVDMIWINGPNFASMKGQDLLFGPFAEALPNWQYVDVENKDVQTDFTLPVEGYEAPWAMAQVVFIYDEARVPEPPKSMPALLDWAKANPRRFTFPQPPDFLGSTFLKQALIDLNGDDPALSKPVEEADYEAATAALWTFIEDLTPNLWRQGRAYPQTGPRQLQLIADGEVDIAISFSPGEASTAIANNELPPTARTYVLDGGTLGNASFVAIPYNSSAKSGAMVVADFLMSPEAQARAQDPAVLGYGTVLSMDKLPEESRATFDALDLGPATLSPAELGTAQPEPHPSWTTRLTEEWVKKHGVTE
ncbi:ABC transporter substrate-binding protein [Oceanicola sp. D3]|uniref:ABC transporter substrate-binding protein n=1 Tax=Oceanicola sp. D3 TaxID=2587163 RepID=UPI0011211780|nr:ABC transporter substrate-binding protein [Oceanicola sp. D3]QDC09936.1 ABC transporter substrate-binding protein [Oceanicola sp. D3]